MTKFYVKDYSLRVLKNKEGAENLYLSCTLEKPKTQDIEIRHYRFCQDNEFKEMDILYHFIDYGLNNAKKEGTKIDISPSGRLYVFMTLPDRNKENKSTIARITGEEMEEFYNPNPTKS
ncbi:hypothetical protein [Gilliamella apicola]|uniref:Uncharacterized protein n=1 Tax=Gilliamella apicola TaxID=1196095 RepID=A0A2V4E4Z8_9GAMM|nr:hypothetical protein [Gilliamella apicola]PXZ03457.1 hypothetical protein DKK79_11470 [Gilliamella apicola]